MTTTAATPALTNTGSNNPASPPDAGGGPALRSPVGDMASDADVTGSVTTGTAVATAAITSPATGRTSGLSVVTDTARLVCQRPN